MLNTNCSIVDTVHFFKVSAEHIYGAIETRQRELERVGVSQVHDVWVRPS